MSLSKARYQEIAAAFAERLINGEYKEGDRIYLRSSLAGSYGVSPETARRAAALLAELGVLEIHPGSGAVFLSSDKAVEFVHHFRQNSYLETVQEELNESIRCQHQELDKMSRRLREISEKAMRHQQENPFIPYHCTIPTGSRQAGKTLGDCNFWHHTGATVVALRRGEELTISPGPMAILAEGCTVYFIGEPACTGRVHTFLSALPQE